MEPAKDRYRVKRGEPGCHEVIPLINGSPSFSSSLPSVPIENKSIILSKRDELGNYRVAFLKGFEDEAFKRNKSPGKFLDEFLELYNSGACLSATYRKLGHVSRRTFFRWKGDFLEEGIKGLIPKNGRKNTSKITDHEENFLLTVLRHQNRIKIAHAITLTKEYLARKQIESPSSPATLRRFVDQFRREHYDLWVLHREGEKALNDKVLPYAERDWRLLDVGDGLVADGHRLNFQVINPATGKPCRAALVLFWDWKSSYPLGWEIMLEENIQCVTSALRNAILALGKTPKWVLLDNGKAFRAKIFTQDVNFEDSELPGMFTRLNINCHFAQPYNAQAKPIERFFATLNDQLERMIPSYTGASINDKPAWTKRNEKLARAAHDPWIPTVQEADGLIRAYRGQYAERPSRGRDGLRPIDIFNEGKGPGVDPAELIFLMMDHNIRTLHRNGLTWLGRNWFHESMYGLRDKVVIRYSLCDLSQIAVLHKNEFLCWAKPVESVHPMASESENPKDMEAVKEVIRLKKKVKNTTRRLSVLLDSRLASEIDWSRTRTPEIAEVIQKIENEKKPKAKDISPFIDGAVYGEDPKMEKPKYKLPRDWAGFKGDWWEMYEHLKKQDPNTWTSDNLDFFAWFETTSEYQATQNIKPNQLLLGGLE